MNEAIGVCRWTPNAAWTPSSRRCAGVPQNETLARRTFRTSLQHRQTDNVREFIGRDQPRKRIFSPHTLIDKLTKSRGEVFRVYCCCWILTRTHTHTHTDTRKHAYAPRQADRQTDRQKRLNPKTSGICVWFHFFLFSVATWLLLFADEPMSIIRPVVGVIHSPIWTHTHTLTCTHTHTHTHTRARTHAHAHTHMHIPKEDTQNEMLNT